jgi:zinc and cadmium transporter
MFDAWIYSLVSVVLVSLISLVGVSTLIFKDSTLRKVLLYFVSFAAGALLGDAFIHLLPEAAKESGFTVMISFSIITGIVFFFIMEKIIQWRHCHMPVSREHPHPLTYMNLFGDSVHNFIDGLIIGASYLASIPIGIATTIAVVFHEIPHEMGNFGVLLHGGFTRKKAILFNFLSAIIAIAGTIAALLIGVTEGANPYLLGFAAGGFVYIAATDLIPELHKGNVHPEGFSKTAIGQLFFLLLGIGMMFSLLLVG